MVIDLSKLFYNQTDSISINEKVEIPKEYYQDNEDIKEVSTVSVLEIYMKMEKILH